MVTLVFSSIDGKATVYVGDAAEFAAQEDAAADVLGQLEGKVAWIDWIEAARPRSGNALLDMVLDELHAADVAAVGAHVVPVGADSGDPAVRRLAAFYARHNFTDVSSWAPWSEWPVVLTFLD